MNNYSMKVSEKDWKLFSCRIGKWQERYMEKLNQEYIEILSDVGPASEKFHLLRKRINKDYRSPGVIIDMRRSMLLDNIIQLIVDGVISFDELNDFSDGLREAVKFLTQ